MVITWNHLSSAASTRRSAKTGAWEIRHKGTRFVRLVPHEWKVGACPAPQLLGSSAKTLDLAEVAQGMLNAPYAAV